MSDDDVEFFEDAVWQIEEDGTEFFEAEGRRFELGDDGYAYDVGPARQPSPVSEQDGSSGGPSDPAVPPSPEPAASSQPPPSNATDQTPAQPPAVDDRPAEPDADDEVEYIEDVAWQVEEDGTEFFEAEGRRFELGDDGFAYEVGPAGAQAEPVEPADTTVLPPVPAGTGDAAHDPVPEAQAADETTAIPAVEARERPGGNGGADTTGQVPVVAPPPGMGDRVASSSNGSGGNGVPREPLLKVRGLRSGYGKLPVLHGVDVDIHVGETAVLFGLNGAGKTTTAMNVCGALDVWDGSLEFDGHDITKWGIRQCVDEGIVMVPEGRRVFPALTVAKNLQVGSWSQRKDEEWVDGQLETVLGYFPRLRERLGQDAGTLSGGEQQMLAMARGLMANPRLLIIDEASMGLAPVIVTQVFKIIEQINDDGVTVLMIEQNVGALDVADIGIVMEQGTIIRRLQGDDLTDRSVISEALMS